MTREEILAMAQRIWPEALVCGPSTMGMFTIFTSPTLNNHNSITLHAETAAEWLQDLERRLKP